MARKPSPHTRYRRSRAKLAHLGTERATLERTRPRTRGKKAAKTRALNKLSRQISAAKGLLTKARNAIALAARSKKAGASVAKRKRSEAATKGWQKRRAAKSTGQTGDVWLHLLPDGTTTPVVVDKADSSLEGRYWNAHLEALGGKPEKLYEFAGRSVLDLGTQKRFPFVTDLDVINEHFDELDFGQGFYKRGGSAPGEQG